jgi:hypothetical protein
MATQTMSTTGNRVNMARPSRDAATQRTIIAPAKACASSAEKTRACDDLERIARTNTRLTTRAAGATPAVEQSDETRCRELHRY